MKLFARLDPDDPLSLAISRLKRQATLFSVITLGTVMAAVAVGVPHVQVTYRYFGSVRRHIPPEHRQKFSADYLGPFGWQTVDRSDSGGRLTFVEFLPLHSCIDFQQYESVFPFWLLPKEYRDGRPAR